jgi:hypothetical protein
MRDSTYREPFIEWGRWRSLLGTMTDAELDRQIGCSRSAVIRERHNMGIEPAPNTNTAKRWSKSDLALLGTDADSVVAQKIGCAEMTVRRERVKRGIPPAHPERDHRQSAAGLVAAAHLPADVARQVVAAARRARRMGLTHEQVRIVFGPLVREERNHAT